MFTCVCVCVCVCVAFPKRRAEPPYSSYVYRSYTLFSNSNVHCIYTNRRSPDRRQPLLEGDGCTFCSSVVSEFSVVPLTTSLRPRGGSGSTRVAPGVVLNLLGRGFRDAVARAVSFLSRPLSSSSLHSLWCS